MASTGTIQTEIERLEKAKADIKTAIINKGGTISDTATIDTYASAINGISTGGGVPIVEIELPKIDNPDEPARFKIPAEKAEFLKKNPFVIISAKNDRNVNVYFMPYETYTWRRIVYDPSSYDEITPNIEVIQIYEDNAMYRVIIKSSLVVSSIKYQRPVDRWLRSYIPSEEAVYNEIHKTE